MTRTTHKTIRTLAWLAGSCLAAVAGGQTFSLDDNASMPLFSPPVPPFLSAEDPYGLGLPATAAGLMGILNSSTLWATNLWCLNDPKEVQYPHDTGRLYLEGKSRECKPRMRPLVAYSLEVFDKFLVDNFPYEYQFSVSFSLAGDQAEQWWDYADRGKGYAIGFDKYKLINCLQRR